MGETVKSILTTTVSKEATVKGRKIISYQCCAPHNRYDCLRITRRERKDHRKMDDTGRVKGVGGSFLGMRHTVALQKVQQGFCLDHDDV